MTNFVKKFKMDYTKAHDIAQSKILNGEYNHLIKKEIERLKQNNIQ